MINEMVVAMEMNSKAKIKPSVFPPTFRKKFTKSHIHLYLYQDLRNCHSERITKDLLCSNDFLKDGIFLIYRDLHSEESLE